MAEGRHAGQFSLKTGTENAALRKLGMIRRPAGNYMSSRVSLNDRYVFSVIFRFVTIV